MKKGFGFSFVLICLMLIGLVSAASLSVSNLLDDLNTENVVLFLVFIVSFTLLFFSLNKFFKGNKATASVVSLALSFGITYWINESGWDLDGFISDIGISSDILAVLIPLLAMGLCIFLIVKLKRNSLLVFGGIFLLSAFFVYEKEIAIIIGLVLLILRVFFKKKRTRRYYDLGGGRSPRTRKHSVSFSGPRENWVRQRDAANRRADEEAEVQERMQRVADKRRRKKAEKERRRREKEIEAQNQRILSRGGSPRARNLRAQRRMEAEENWRREQEIEAQNQRILSRKGSLRAEALKEQRRREKAEARKRSLRNARDAGGGIYDNAKRAGRDRRREEQRRVEDARRETQRIRQELEQKAKKISADWKEVQNMYAKAERTANGYWKKLEESGRAMENAKARYNGALRSNQGVHQAERSYKKLLEQTNDLNARYQKSQLEVENVKRYASEIEAQYNNILALLKSQR